MKGLITCFEDFADVRDNTSRLVVEKLNLPYKVLPVSFERCDHELPDGLDVLIQVGVAASRSKITIERYAHNLQHSATQADNDDQKPIHQEIYKGAPAAIETNINPKLFDDLPGLWEWSLSAGSYVCNALYFKSLYRLKNTQIIFIHIPHHLKANDPQQSLIESQEFILNVWSKITKNKEAR